MRLQCPLSEVKQTSQAHAAMSANDQAIRKVCREFVVLCRRLELFSEASVAIDGSKFKAVNTRDRNFTQAKMQRRLEQIDESIARYDTDKSEIL